MVALTVGTDQLAKFLIRSRFDPTESLALIPSVLHLTYVQNTGAAFGLFRGYAGVFIVVSVVMAGWLLMELSRSASSRRRSAALGLSLILGGALGNLIDRVRFGYVIDFLDVRIWPVFNFADSAITVGVTLLLLSSVRRVKGRGARGEGSE